MDLLFLAACRTESTLGIRMTALTQLRYPTYSQHLQVAKFEPSDVDSTPRRQKLAACCEKKLTLYAYQVSKEQVHDT